mmetsp:Transcript_40305/g.118084  ORF Transcript_40305/g.118084 Transcript_40305/m.118084 type:complete len:239 (-) Transcript_40305:177-893(-)
MGTLRWPPSCSSSSPCCLVSRRRRWPSCGAARPTFWRSAGSTQGWSRCSIRCVRACPRCPSSRSALATHGSRPSRRRGPLAATRSTRRWAARFTRGGWRGRREAARRRRRSGGPPRSPRASGRTPLRAAPPLRPARLALPRPRGRPAASRPATASGAAAARLSRCCGATRALAPSPRAPPCRPSSLAATPRSAPAPTPPTATTTPPPPRPSPPQLASACPSTGRRRRSCRPCRRRPRR